MYQSPRSSPSRYFRPHSVFFGHIGIVPARNDHDATDLDVLVATFVACSNLRVLPDWLTSIAGVIFVQFFWVKLLYKNWAIFLKRKGLRGDENTAERHCHGFGLMYLGIVLGELDGVHESFQVLCCQSCLIPEMIWGSPLSGHKCGGEFDQHSLK